MKKIRPAIFAMLLLIMVMSVTACGSNNSNTQSSTGASQNSSSAATSTSTSSQETTGMETSSMDTEGDGGIIDGIMNDVEKGAHDVKDGVDDITGESGTVNESGANNTTESR
ncbi:MAG: hypothetical protein LUK37_01360 [Clostridia bacterium]|nr:hypothetical protein [Clostridia bacterium]